MFRFENLEIWKRAGDIAMPLFELADDLENKKCHRFAEQLRAAALSVPNNIAEGSGSASDKDFTHFLNIARRSTFECASMILIFGRRGLISPDQKERLVADLDELCRMITAFAAALRAKTERGKGEIGRRRAKS